MKLDLPLQLWFAWQDGDSASVQRLLDDTFKYQKITGRIPSRHWQFVGTDCQETLIKAIMLSSRWVMKDKTGEYIFMRGSGLPHRSTGQFSWNFPFIIVER